jgi:hypothetical protein
MGARGPAAKPVEQRRNRAKKVVDEVKLGTVEPGTPPELPTGSWHVNVIRWWDAWHRTPAAVLFCDTEWERLLRALPVAQAYWVAVDLGEPGPIFAAHKALLEAEKGLPATDYERRRAGIHVKQVAPEPVSSPAERRERIRLA